MADTQIPPQPFFGLGPGTAGGTVVLSGVSFADLTNTSSISSGTLTLYYWNEIVSRASDRSSWCDLSKRLGANIKHRRPRPTWNMAANRRGDTYRLGKLPQWFTVHRFTRGGRQYRCKPCRGYACVPFGKSDKRRPLSTWLLRYSIQRKLDYPIALPDIRICSAELFMTNEKR